MPNIMSALKSEIVRLSRKEAKQVVAPVQRASANYRALIAALRRQVDAMQKELLALRRAVPGPGAAIQAKAAPEGRFWISGKGVKTLRKRLGLTQAQFGKLVGVSVVTVVKWEAHKGKTPIRLKAAIARLQAIRKMGKKQAAEMLGLGKGKAAPSKRKNAVPAPKAKKAKPGRGKPKKG